MQSQGEPRVSFVQSLGMHLFLHVEFIGCQQRIRLQMNRSPFGKQGPMFGIVQGGLYLVSSGVNAVGA